MFAECTKYFIAMYRLEICTHFCLMFYHQVPLDHKRGIWIVTQGHTNAGHYHPLYDAGSTLTELCPYPHVRMRMDRSHTKPFQSIGGGGER